MQAAHLQNSSSIFLSSTFEQINYLSFKTVSATKAQLQCPLVKYSTASQKKEVAALDNIS